MVSFKAAVRCVTLKSIGSGRAGIGAAESHAKRLDPVAQKRRVRESDPIAWSKGDGPLDYVDAFKKHKREFGASERANSGLAMEFKIVVSPEWLKETGSPHDENNPRVQQLYDEALKWAESWGGASSSWSARYDTDETGSGVVDIFLSPIREQKHKSGKSKQVISCRKAKEELLAAERALDPSIRTSGAAMQSSWARWCQEKLDSRIERGTPKEETQANHIHADVYAKAAEETRQLFEAHIFPDPFAPPSPPTPEQARMIAKIEEIKKNAAKKASDEARRAEIARAAENEAKLQEAIQRANLKERELSQKIEALAVERSNALAQAAKQFKQEQRQITQALQQAFGLSKARFHLDSRDIYGYFIKRFEDYFKNYKITFDDFLDHLAKEIIPISEKIKKEKPNYSEDVLSCATGMDYLAKSIYETGYKPHKNANQNDVYKHIKSYIYNKITKSGLKWRKLHENSELLFQSPVSNKSLNDFVLYFGEMCSSRGMAKQIIKPIDEINYDIEHDNEYAGVVNLTNREKILRKAVMAFAFGLALISEIGVSLEKAGQNLKQYAERMNSTQEIAKDLNLDPEQRYQGSTPFS